MTSCGEGQHQSAVSCQCGKVRILFPESSPRFRYACLCEDCRQKALWSSAHGGPAVPRELVDYEKGFDTIYFGNSIIVERGQHELEFFKLREGARSTSCVSKCCKTGLLVDNLGYRELCVLVQSDVAVIETDLSSPAAFYGFVLDFPDHKIADLQQLHPEDQSKSYVPSDGDSNFASRENVAEWIAKNLLPPTATENSSTFQKLQEEAGAVTILNLRRGEAVDDP